MIDQEALIKLERGFWDAAGRPEGGKYYEENFDDAGVLLLPFDGGMLDKKSVIPIIPKSKPWKQYDFSNTHILPINDNSAVLCYEVHASHGDDQFHAYASSVYMLKSNKRWQMLTHQQTSL